MLDRQVGELVGVVELGLVANHVIRFEFVKVGNRVFQPPVPR